MMKTETRIRNMHLRWGIWLPIHERIIVRRDLRLPSQSEIWACSTTNRKSSITMWRQALASRSAQRQTIESRAQKLEWGLSWVMLSLSNHRCSRALECHREASIKRASERAQPRGDTVPSRTHRPLARRNCADQLNKEALLNSEVKVAQRRTK